MADWKQITARIRRARSGKDPVGQLSGLFEKTRDAMVAFELARVLETSGQNSDAAKWYIAAAERFRRADWKSKAQEAAVRLGADISAASADSVGTALPSDAQVSDSLPPSSAVSQSTDTSAEPEESALVAESQTADMSAPTSGAVSEDDRKRRRRGRRGGRNRRGKAQSNAPMSSSVRTASSAPTVEEVPQSVPAENLEAEAPTRTRTPRRFGPSFTTESVPESNAVSLRGRSGDPGLSSRLSALEMQLRRLLSCSPAKLNDSDHAPAGPGVLVLTDSDLTSYYYVEACPTLRVAVGNLLRGGSSRRGVDSIKPRLAEHLGIPETRVGKYLADHCVVRWLQLDEGASHFAHFVIAVLRPTLNE
jgi:hypothetical protein